MEISRIKKVTMQAVKICILFLFLIFTISCKAQEIARGKYVQEYPSYNVSGIGITYHFTDSTFTKTTYEHLGTETITKGSYKIVEDTLIFDYRLLKDPAPSYWKIVNKDSLLTLMGENSYLLADGIKVQFRSVDRKGKAIGGTNLIVRNKEEEPITGFVADSIGYFPRMFFYGNYIQYFDFTFIGRKDVTIKADTLRGYSSTINVVLSNSQVYYSNYGDTRKYLIKKTEKDKIVLESLAGNKEIILTRQG